MLKYMRGFSLFEVLISLALTSFMLILFLQHLQSFSFASLSIVKTMQAQDDAISTLLLLQHQIESASLSECANTGFENLTESPDFNTLNAYGVLQADAPLLSDLHWKLYAPGNGQPVNQVLLAHNLANTFYINSPLIEKSIATPKDFEGTPGDFVVVDDCKQALITKIANIGGGELLLQGFEPSAFSYPISISLIQDRMYYLGKIGNEDAPYALYRKNYGEAREMIIPNLSAIVFAQASSGLQITVKPQYGEGSYHVTL